MAVISVSGVVGQVLRVSGSYADVLMLTDGLSAAGVTVQRSGLRGLVVGDGSDQLQVSFLRRSDAHGVSPGDLVVTSGEDGVFPQGVIVGKVLKAEAPETGLFLNINLEPAAALHRLDEVMVVVELHAGV